MHIEINIYSTRKGFEECVRRETAHLATFKSKKYLKVLSSEIDPAEIRLIR